MPVILTLSAPFTRALELRSLPRRYWSVTLSSLWEVPAYLIMAFSLALDAPVEKASRASAHHSSQISAVSLSDVPRGAAMPEAIWLRAVKSAGPHSSVLQYYADRIFITSSGKPYVPSDSDRAEIGALQNNSEVVTRVIAAATRTNQTLLSALGNKPTPGVLLIAHVHGIASAQRFCAALARNAQTKAADALPELAGELNPVTSISVAALEAKLTQLVRGGTVQPLDGAGRNSERFAFGVRALKGTVTQSDPAPNGSLARLR